MDITERSSMNSIIKIMLLGVKLLTIAVSAVNSQATQLQQGVLQEDQTDLMEAASSKAVNTISSRPTKNAI